MAASADPPEHLAEILREILSLAGNKSVSSASERGGEEAERKPEEEESLRDAEE
ncbi:MAG: hypothetical protein QOH24_2358 [Verrucomicrobiota bacterium]|jgi:hypothetical protein